MTTLEKKLEGKKNVASGVLNQAKGVVREQLGNLSNDDATRLAGKKDQIVGKLQRDYGDSWAVHNSNWVLLGTAVTTFLALLTFLYARKQA